MTSSSSGEGTPVASATEALHEDIERTREELGETVQALVAKIDIKARAKERAAAAAEGLRQKAGQVASSVSERASSLTSGASSARNGEPLPGSAGATATGARQLPGRAANVIRGNPAMAGAVGAAAAGLIVCLVVFWRSRR